MSNSPKLTFQVRPTAYRAWDGRKMVDVQTLCWNASGAIWYGQNSQFGYAWINPDFKGWTDDNPKPSERDICPVMQWTGLRDVNGKDIYEGDICNDGSVVTHIRERFELVYPIGYNESLMGGEDDEVVGNIFQNPELLET